MSKQSNNKATAATPQAKKMPIKGSTTEEIWRSQIIFNPYNPKRHTDRQVKTQAKNIKRNGYLGGIVWNKTTGNLINGHRRVQALDIIHKYDGTPDTDYTIKVEVVEFDEATEKEQMTYMAVGNSKADFNLIATYASDIDITQLGLSQDEMQALTALYQSAEYSTALSQAVDASAQAAQSLSTMADLGDDFLSPRHTLDTEEKTFDQIAQDRAEKPNETAEAIKAKKQRNNEIAENRNIDRQTYIMLAFKDPEELQEFCDVVGIYMHENMIMNGMDFLDKLGA
ncbi:MAG: ParB N-terminal domain-containing protein [Bacteroidales bacterium]|nr:ParB N-terminal domain-containing protein [Bacteroidales bacterium]